ncbi:ABC transporter substrate-binding protein [Gaetbulibacter sp. M235]|uniref:ABC transporter substrate-binding protein n=1 Tax=Gaetbulibacter sp. M235 TaxID=3126510 RepID=UPI00374E4DC5
MNFNYKFLFFILIISLSSCKNDQKKQSTDFPSNATVIKNEYAKGFEVTDFGVYKVLTIKSPWPNSKKTYNYALVQKDMLSKISLNANDFDAVITIPIEKIVVTSTTHLPSLELLHVEKTLVGFPETDFISSEKIRQLIDNGNVRELGKNESINTEILLETKPNLVVGFGIDGNNRAFETIKNSGIPVIYNGDWVENSPLAKAEWIKFFGVLFNKEKDVDSIFNSIEKNYLEAKSLAKNVKNKPTILSGAMYKDIWYLPSGTSTEAQLLKDANTNYLWQDSEGSGSLQLNFESVFEKAKNADVWLSPSNFSSLEALKNANIHNTMFKAFQNKSIYSFTNTTGKTGGILYFELGMTRPDLVLKDLIKICHPELLEDYEPYFFKPLE